MTANPLKPVGRYRPGKPIAEEASSSGEDEEEEDEQQVKEQQRKQLEQRRASAPKANSFPTTRAPATGKITKGVEGVKLQEEEDDDEAGFVTEEEEEEEQGAKGREVRASRTDDNQIKSEEEESEEDEEEESPEEEESSSEDEAPKRVLLRPTFIKKDKRKEATRAVGANGAQINDANDPGAEAAAALRKEKADILIRDQLEREAEARAAGKKAWDDDIDENNQGTDEAHVDDTDGLDPAAELAAWKLRELKRVKREREAIEVAEREREEIERRRNLAPEEREREDREFLAKQKEEREEGRGKAGFMQRYFHRGAFFQEEGEQQGLDKRDVMGGRFVDEVRNREALPQYLQVRDMTKIGRKGRTRYRDLKSEDTGRWGAESYSGRPGGGGMGGGRGNAPFAGVTDDRFLPDHLRGDGRDAKGPTGANAAAIRERPTNQDRDQDRERRRRSPSRSRSRRRSPIPRRRRSYSRSESRSRSPPRRDRYRNRSRDDRNRRKRSPSPRYEERDKRRRVESAR
jgi:microfibrillar-associated protein 1